MKNNMQKYTEVISFSQWMECYMRMQAFFFVVGFFYARTTPNHVGSDLLMSMLVFDTLPR